MDYPNNFNIPTFPAGKTIAFSRGISVWISVILFLIFCSCGLLLLGLHLRTNYPFLISVDPFTEEWTVIAYPGRETKEVIPQYQIVQEKLVNDFVKNWFTVYADAQQNEIRWQECVEEQCLSAEQFNPDNTNCAIYCKSDKKVFNEFQKNVLPDYRSSLVANSITWMPRGILITSSDLKNEEDDDTIKPTGKWQAFTTIQASNGTSFNVLVFIDVSQDYAKYPATLGYYIKDFNSYRIVNE